MILFEQIGKRSKNKILNSKLFQVLDRRFQYNSYVWFNKLRIFSKK